MPFGRRSFLLRPFLMAPSPGGARGFTPSRALPWGRRSQPSAPYAARASSEFRSPSFLSRAAGGARGFTPSRALPWGRRSRPSVPNVAAHVPGISNRLVFLPRRRGCERVHTLSRSPMGSQDAAKCAKRCRARSQDFACSVSFPRCRRGERVHTLSRSPVGSQDAAECAIRCRARPQNFESTRFSPASLGVREGPRPLALSHGVVSRSRELQSIPLL